METEQKKIKKKSGRPRKSENWTADLLWERAKRYFEKCDARTRVVVTKEGTEEVPRPAPYTIEGLCDYLDIPRRQFDAWLARDGEIGLRAQKIHTRIVANRIEGGLDGSQNGAFAQFLLKNNDPDHYREKVEVEGTVSEQAASMFEEWGKMWAKK